MQVTPQRYAGVECQLAGVPLPGGPSTAGDASQLLDALKQPSAYNIIPLILRGPLLLSVKINHLNSSQASNLCLTNVCFFAAASPLQLDTTQGTGVHNLTFQAPDTFTVSVSSLAEWLIAESLTFNATGPIVSFNSSLAQVGGSATATIREPSFLRVPRSLCCVAADLNRLPSNSLVIP